MLAQSRRDKHAALKLMRKLLKKFAFARERLVTDDLRSYGAAARDLGIEHLHEGGRWKNNRAENSQDIGGHSLSGRQGVDPGGHAVRDARKLWRAATDDDEHYVYAIAL